jgi:hypothetical protein
LVAAFGVGAQPSRTIQDSPTARADVLNAAFAYRIDYLGASDKIDPCALKNALGDTTLMTRLLPRVADKLFARTPAWCGVPDGRRWPTEMVKVDSLVVSRSGSRLVYLWVARGDYAHRERLTVVRAAGVSSGPNWIVNDIYIDTFVIATRRMTIPPPG